MASVILQPVSSGGLCQGSQLYELTSCCVAQQSLWV
jgi:hypothetical protein